VDFFALPAEEQLRRAEEAARAALARWAIPPDATLEVLKHRENTVFAVRGPDARPLGALRVHVPGYQTAASIRAEFAWMRALGDVGVRTPGPIPATDGALVVTVAVAGEVEARLVDLLEWIEGHEPHAGELTSTFALLGELHARCHRHASTWTPPAGFTRQAWDETALLDGGHPCVAPAWDNWALSADQRALVLACRDVLRARLAAWGKRRDRYGLVHADLMPDNVLLTADGVRLIDFDDAGFGWYLYDAASALLVYHGSDLYEPLRDAWARGYRRQRPLSDADLDALPSFLVLRCFYALGWLHRRRTSSWAEAYIGPVLDLTTRLGGALVSGTSPAAAP
jgi:Ser/Thr protein kinase RdoA (MazF antagonist)